MMQRRDDKWIPFGLATIALLASAGAAPAGAQTANTTDVENAVCSEATDPLSIGFNYISQALVPVKANPANVVPTPRTKVFVPTWQRGGLSQKRIVMFGDMFGMPKDTPAWVSDEFRSIFTRADLVLGNVEAPISYNNGVLELDSDQTFNFHANVAYLKSTMAQFCMDPAKTVFTVANNHAGDRVQLIGETRWNETVANAGRVGATIVGVDRYRERQPEITVKDIGDLRVGIVGWTHLQNNAPAEDANGIIYPTWEASRRVFEQTNWGVRKRDLGLDLLIGMPHWDCQWHWFPNPYTVDKATALHDAGFDLIAGTHQGLQPARVFPGTDNDLTFYGLGALNNGLGWSSYYLVTVAEMVVDGNGRTLEYTLHPFVQRKVDSASNWLRGTPLCGSKLFFDWPRTSDWQVVPLASLANGTSSERDFYRMATEQLDMTFPR
jgi:hypothetical protein